MSKSAELRELLRTAEPAGLGPERRSGTWSEAEIRRETAKIAPQGGEALTALVLLWHDHLDASHTISQGIAGADGAFVHGIMHRREPDYGNAAYWFRRVGKHPTFGEIAQGAGALLDGAERKELRDKLLPGGTWNPFAFIQACEENRSGEARTTGMLRKTQQVEFECLLEWLAHNEPAA